MLSTCQYSLYILICMAHEIKNFNKNFVEPFSQQRTSYDVLPRSLKLFIKYRVIETFGFCLISFSIALFFAILSYSSEDTSLNTAGRLIPQNYLGNFGAFTSDILLQSIGFACLVPLLTIFIWGIRIIASDTSIQ